MSFPLPDELFRLQSSLLSKKQGLLQLFDLFQAVPCFSVPEREPTVSLDNITFGPHQYNIFVSQLQGSNMRIIYYCLLYYIFERNPDHLSLQVYQSLLRHISENNISMNTSMARIKDEQMKVYLVKFLHSMWRARSKHKLIVEELSTLPQMDVLLVHLMQAISGQQDLIIEINATDIQTAVKKQLGFTIEFLTNELFIFQEEYLAEIRHYHSHCSFLVRRDKPENIQALRHEIMIRQSAFFLQQIGEGLQREQVAPQVATKRKFKVTKKSTVKSIGLESAQNSDYEEERVGEDNEAFSGILSKGSELENDKLQESITFLPTQCSIEDFSKKINAALIRPNFSSIPKGMVKQTEEKQSQMYESQPAICTENEMVNSQLFSSKEIHENPQKSGHHMQKVKRLNLRFYKEGPYKPNKFVGNQTSIKKMRQTGTAGYSVYSRTSQTKSMRCHQNKNNLQHSFYQSDIRKNHKDSFYNHQARHTCLDLKTLSYSQSTKIMSDGFDTFKTKKGPQKPVRIPAFILNRQKAKEKLALAQNARADEAGGERWEGVPQITFSYSSV